MSRPHLALLALLAGAAAFHTVPALAGTTVAVGDLDNDGLQDLVVVDASGNVNVIFSHADGSFDLTIYAPGDLGTPTSVVVADVNGDGWPDVIITDGDDAATGVHVLLNNGDGTLGPKKVYASGPAGAPGPQSIVAVDLNSDGKYDLVTANGSQDSISVLLNNGDGSFAAPVSYATGADPVSLAVADMNADGWPDVVTSDSGDDTVSLLLNNGDGTFAPAITLGVGSSPVSVTLADVNGDGHPDILVADRDDDTAGVLLGNGDGTFAKPKFYTTGLHPGWIAASDLAGDGSLDIVTDNYDDGSVSTLANNGDGTFQRQQLLYPNYGSDDTVVMDIPGSATPALVSVDLQVSSVVVSHPATRSKSGTTHASQHVYNVQGGKIVGDSGKTGAFDLLSLLLLGAALSARRRFHG